MGECTKATRRPAQVTFNTATMALGVGLAECAMLLAGRAEGSIDRLFCALVGAAAYFVVSNSVVEGIVALQLSWRPFQG